LHLVLRVRGGGGGEMRYVPAGMEMGVAAGGLIEQTIIQDQGKLEWDTTQTKVFNVQILNSHHFQAVTGIPPPESCVTVETYKRHGYPFYHIYDEPSTIAGNFDGIKSVGEMDAIEEALCKPETSWIPGGFHLDKCISHDFFNPNGPASKFRSVAEIKKDIEKQGQTLF
jgi:hypothetical protein